MRHTSLLFVALLLGCSGTPVSTSTTPTYPKVLPPPTEYPVDSALSEVIAYRDALDRYVEYLKDYSNRISADHKLLQTWRQNCPVLISAGTLTIPPPPQTVGLDEQQTVNALIDYIAELRQIMFNYNRSLQSNKDNVDAVCKTIR